MKRNTRLYNSKTPWKKTRIFSSLSLRWRSRKVMCSILRTQNAAHLQDISRCQIGGDKIAIRFVYDFQIPRPYNKEQLVLCIGCFPFFINHIQRRVQYKLREVRRCFLLFHYNGAASLHYLSQQQWKVMGYHFQILQNELDLP